MSGFIFGSGFIGGAGFMGGGNSIIPHIGEFVEFSYTGGVQVYPVKYTGIYQLLTEGAQGGGARDNTVGAPGGLAVGYMYLTKGETLYVNVGGMGDYSGTSGLNEYTLCAGGYNGGGGGRVNKNGGGYGGGGGGGATHIATANGLLSQIDYSKLLLCGGGGGGTGNNLIFPPPSYTSQYIASVGEPGGYMSRGYAVGYGESATLDSAASSGGGGGYHGGQGGQYGSGACGGLSSVNNVNDYMSNKKYTVNGTRYGYGRARVTIFAA